LTEHGNEFVEIRTGDEAITRKISHEIRTTKENKEGVEVGTRDQAVIGQVTITDVAVTIYICIILVRVVVGTVRLVETVIEHVRNLIAIRIVDKAGVRGHRKSARDKTGQQN